MTTLSEYLHNILRAKKTIFSFAFIAIFLSAILVYFTIQPIYVWTFWIRPVSKEGLNEKKDIESFGRVFRNSTYLKANFSDLFASMIQKNDFSFGEPISRRIYSRVGFSVYSDNNVEFKITLRLFEKNQPLSVSEIVQKLNKIIHQSNQDRRIALEESIKKQYLRVKTLADFDFFVNARHEIESEKEELDTRFITYVLRIKKEIPDANARPFTFSGIEGEIQRLSTLRIENKISDATYAKNKMILDEIQYGYFGIKDKLALLEKIRGNLYVNEINTLSAELGRKVYRDGLTIASITPVSADFIKNGETDFRDQLAFFLASLFTFALAGLLVISVILASRQKNLYD